uniref:Uncharacterized protein n=1 Tax=Lotus japonicus TaxID=34305 RepID=I3S9K5_LOTJA|nr:unknown [Lotus japonicus]
MGSGIPQLFCCYPKSFLHLLTSYPLLSLGHSPYLSATEQEYFLLKLQYS